MRSACLYISNFPAWAYQQVEPQEKRIAVYARGRIIARSGFLRQVGLALDEPLDRARSLFPEADFRQRESQLEEAVWEDVLQQVNGITPRLLSVKPGWLLFKPYTLREAKTLAETLRVQIGLAPYGSLAMLAAVRAGIRHVLNIRPTAIDAFLGQWPVQYLEDLDFESELIERLELFGLNTAKRLAELSRRHLEAQFGPDGIRLYELLHPDPKESDTPLFQPPPCILATFEFEYDTVEPGDLLPVIEHLLKEAVQQLGANQCRRLTLRLTNASGLPDRIARRVLKSSTNQIKRLFALAETMLMTLLQADEPVSAVTVELGGLHAAAPEQGSLFFQRPPVQKAILAAHERFPGMIKRVVVENPDAPFPEDGVSWVGF